MQGGLLVLGLAREAVLPGESQHVLHSVVDTQSAGVVEWGAAFVILAGQQGLHTVMLRLDAPETHTHTHSVMYLSAPLKQSKRLCSINSYYITSAMTAVNYMYTHPHSTV